MKKVFAIMVVLLLVASFAMAAKPVEKNTYTIDIDGTTIVVVEETLKDTKKTTVIEKSYFAEDYLEYLGQELIVNGEVFVDTFPLNN